MTDEKTLYDHMRYHEVREWMLRAAEDDDARTIGEAIKRLSPRRFRRRLARMLAK